MLINQHSYIFVLDFFKKTCNRVTRVELLEKRLKIKI